MVAQKKEQKKCLNTEENKVEPKEIKLTGAKGFIIALIIVMIVLAIAFYLFNYVLGYWGIKKATFGVFTAIVILKYAILK